MASTVNEAILIGRFGVEIRRMQSGEAVANSQLATIARWPDKATGETEECTEWQRFTMLRLVLLALLLPQIGGILLMVARSTK